MTANEYQQLVLRTVNKDLPLPMQLATFALGLGGEAGEVQDLIKKHLGHGHPLDRDKLNKELGDCGWYLAVLSYLNGTTLEEVFQQNIEKLKKRYPEGFSTEASLNRKE